MDNYGSKSNNAVDKYSLRGKVFNKIREDILSGHYSEHEELKEAAISKEMGVSRTPVREALRQLELEELVTIIPNKGAYVNSITSKDIYDIYIMRSYLEGLCARWACRNITKQQLEDIEEIIYLSDYHISRGHYEQIFELDNRFHSKLYEASSSRILNHVLTDLHHYVERIRKNTLAGEERAREACDEHKAIVDAIKDKNEDLAEKLGNEHVIKAFENIKSKGIASIMDDTADSGKTDKEGKTNSNAEKEKKA